MHANGRQPQRAPDGAVLCYERHRPEQTTLYWLVKPHASNFITHTQANTGVEAPRLSRMRPTPASNAAYRPTASWSCAAESVATKSSLH